MNSKCNIRHADYHYVSEYDYPMPVIYLGLYGEAGVEYKLRKNNSVFVRFLSQVNAYKDFKDERRPEGNYSWNMSQLKLGYTF